MNSHLPAWFKSSLTPCLLYLNTRMRETEWTLCREWLLVEWWNNISSNLMSIVRDCWVMSNQAVMREGQNEKSKAWLRPSKWQRRSSLSIAPRRIMKSSVILMMSIATRSSVDSFESSRNGLHLKKAIPESKRRISHNLAEGVRVRRLISNLNSFTHVRFRQSVEVVVLIQSISSFEG